MWTRVCGIAVLGLLAGCSTEGRIRPVPAPHVLLSKDARAATIEGHGVRLMASGSSWKSNPWDLTRYVTPVEIVLENHSGRTLRIQYGDFELVGASRSTALPPQSLSRIASSGVPGAGTSHRSSFAQEQDRTYSPANGTNPGDVPCQTCTEPFTPRLPTEDVLRLSVPEGVLVDGASLAGFLYFENLAAPERQATFQVRLVDAKTDEAFGSLVIPFRVHKN